MDEPKPLPSMPRPPDLNTTNNSGYLYDRSPEVSRTFKVRLFGQSPVNPEKDRSQRIMILSGLAVLVVIVLIIVVTSLGKRPAQTELAHAGSTEFDDYASKVMIGNLDKRSGERLNVKYARILTMVQNSGDQIIVGLQLRATVIGTGGQLIREKIITPVPNNRDSLAPNQSMNIDVSLEPVPDPWDIQDMTIEVYGLKLK